MYLRENLVKLKRKSCNYSLRNCATPKLELSCKNRSKGYLTAPHYMLFLKVKTEFLIFFVLKILFPKFLRQVLFTIFIMHYAMNYITENVLHTLL